MIYLKAAFLAVVEGVTEFLPISSTGHLILVEAFLDLSADRDFNTTFLVAIQLPAICAVVLYFWRDLWPWQTDGAKRRALFVMWFKIILAFIPAVIFGLLFEDLMDRYLFDLVPVAIALVIGGIVLIVLEKRGLTVRVESVSLMGWRTALGVGLFQCLALFPGTSRSAATIIGGMILGLSRPAAAEFSFFLAIPTMVGATTYKLWQSGLAFDRQQWTVLAVGSVVSFAVAYAVVAWLMRYIRNHDFSIFGWYRIALGLLVLAYSWYLTLS